MPNPRENSEKFIREIKDLLNLLNLAPADLEKYARDTEEQKDSIT